MDVTPYLGLRWQAMGRGPSFDCWGLVRHVLAHEFDVDVPSFRYGDDPTDALRLGMALFVQVGTPAVGDVVLFVRPLHIGLLVLPRQMLHITHNKDSCIERLDGFRVRRAAGYYRLRGEGATTPV